MSIQFHGSSPRDLPEIGAFSVLQFCHWAGISRAQFYLEVAQGRLDPKKVGRRTIVPVPEARRWMDGLPTSQK